MAADSFTVTVADDYVQATSTVTVDITADSFLTAGDVSKSTTKDKFVDIDVVASANASADLKPLVVKSGSITTPTMGGTAALQSDGTIRYTPETGESGYTDQFDFTLKPSAVATPTDVGRVSVQVLTIDVSLPQSPTVVASKNFSVGYPQAGYTQYGTLAAAYLDATPGTHIWLNDGNYGDFTLDKIGIPAANPIVIRSRNVTPTSAPRSPQGNITGTWTINSPGHWLYELKFSSTSAVSNGYCMAINASDTTITRCWFHTANGPEIPQRNVQRINIGWNRFCTDNDRVGAFLKLWCDNLTTRSGAMHHSNIYRNYFNKTKNSLRSSNDKYLIYLGNGHPLRGDVGQLDEVYIDENYFTGVVKMYLYLKRGITSVTRNVCIASDGGIGQFGIRHGSTRYCNPASLDTQNYPTCEKFIGNRIMVPTCNLSGAGLLVMGNYLGSNSSFNVFAGAETPVSQAASDSVFVSNYAGGGYSLGYHNGANLWEEGGGKLRNVDIWNHTGSAITASNIIHDGAFCLASTFTIHAGTGTGTHPEAPNPLNAANWNPSTDVGFQVANQELLT